MSRPPLTVGIIANPASGRDVRRLTANAGLFSSTDKVSVIQRLLAAFGATGVERVLLPTDMIGIAAAVQKNSHSRQARESHWPALEFLDITLRQSVADTRQAARLMAERGVSLIAVLGGDGTHKAVAGEIGDIPMLTLSTGTNTAFPELREATSAGLAGGLYASGRIPAAIALRRNKRLVVLSNSGRRADLNRHRLTPARPGPSRPGIIGGGSPRGGTSPNSPRVGRQQG